MTSQPYPVAPWPDYPSEGWLLDEDRALRDWMKGMTVSDYASGGKTRNVEAWFGHPDQELREQTYPYVTVDLLQIQEGRERVHRGEYYVGGDQVPYWWNLDALEGDQVGYLLEMPTPVDLDYQISTWARNPRHDRQILQQMITGGRSMLRAGMLHVADKGPSTAGTRRRLDVLSHFKRDYVEDGKRVFNNVFRIRISSEVPWGVIPNLDYFAYGRVKSVETILEENGMKVAEGSVVGGTVVEFYPAPTEPYVSYGSMDVDIDGTVITGVPVARTLLGYPKTGDAVQLSRSALIDEPAGPTDYKYLALSLKESST